MTQKIPPFARQWSGKALEALSEWIEKSEQAFEEITREPRIKVSPHAKFDRYHNKERK